MVQELVDDVLVGLDGLLAPRIAGERGASGDVEGDVLGEVVAECRVPVATLGAAR